MKIMDSLFKDVWKDEKVISTIIASTWHCQYVIPQTRLLDTDVFHRLHYSSLALQVRYKFWPVFLQTHDATWGFGREISWKEDSIIPSGHQITFKNALHIVSTEVLIKLIVPDIALGLTKKFRDVRLAFNELRVQCYLCYLVPY